MRCISICSYATQGLVGILHTLYNMRCTNICSYATQGLVGVLHTLYMHAFIHFYGSTYILTYLHTCVYIYIYTHTYIHTYMQLGCTKVGWHTTHALGLTQFCALYFGSKRRNLLKTPDCDRNRGNATETAGMRQKPRECDRFQACIP
jgi:hypothetical protein